MEAEDASSTKVMSEEEEEHAAEKRRSRSRRSHGHSDHERPASSNEGPQDPTNLTTSSSCPASAKSVLICCNGAAIKPLLSSSLLLVKEYNSSKLVDINHSRPIWGMRALPSEVWERILKMLPASALKHVAPLPEIEVQAALPKVQLCHAVSMNDDGGRRKFRHGRRWLLRLGENRVLYMCFYVLYMVYIP